MEESKFQRIKPEERRRGEGLKRPNRSEYGNKDVDSSLINVNSYNITEI